MMKNRKGFVLTETLVVTVFLVTISTFIYVSIIPLMGRYEDLIDRENNVDIVYKLYHLRKLLYEDDNRSTIVSSDVKDITCDDFANSDYCRKLLNQMDLVNYKFIYVKDIYTNKAAIKAIEEDINTVEISKYIVKYEDDAGEYVILLDRDKHIIAHLLYSPFVQTD